MRYRGTVTNFIPGRGFGFVLPDNQRTLVFAHIRDVRGKLLLRVNDRIEFEIVDTEKGQRAADIQLLDGAATPLNNGGQR